MAYRRLGTLADNFFYFLAHGFQRNAHGFQGFSGHAFAFVDEAEQDVLGADVIVAQLEGLAQGELEDLLGPVKGMWPEGAA